MYVPVAKPVPEIVMLAKLANAGILKIAKVKEALKSALKKKVTEDAAANDLAKKSAIQTEKAKILALNKQKSELNADTTKSPVVKQKSKEEIDLKLRTATDTLAKLNQGKINVV